MSSSGSSDGKEFVFNIGYLGSIPGFRRSPEEGNDNPLQYSCLKNFMDREAYRLQFMGTQRAKYDWMTNTFLFTFSHLYMIPGKSIALTIWSSFVVSLTTKRHHFVGKVMSLLFITLPRFLIAFLQRSKHLLILRLQSQSH